MLEQLEGRQPVLEALRGRRRVQRLFVAEGVRETGISPILEAAQAAGVPIEFVERRRLDQLGRTRQHQGVIAFVEPFRYVEVDDIVEAAARNGEPPLVLVCAEIQDPQNLGALLRTAEAAGAHGAVVPRHRSAPLSPAVARAAAGAIEHLAVARVTNLSRTLEQLKVRGVWVVAASPDAEQVYFDADLTGPLAVVVGSEGRGIPRGVRAHCDFTVRIPMQGRLQSLNVSVAGGILLYEVVRQRQQRAPNTGDRP